MKLRILVVLGLALACAACEKASDVPAIQQELNGIAAGYKQRFDEMEVRGKKMAERLGKIASTAQGFQDANTLFAQAGRTFTQLRELTTRVPSDAANALKANKPEQLRATAEQLTPPKTPNPDKPTDIQLELQRVQDSFAVHLENGYIQVNSALDAVDSWMANAEAAPMRAVTPTAPTDPATPTAPPSPNP